MAFKSREFSKPIYIEETTEPSKVIIVSCEGSVTEPEYFQAIKEKLGNHISSLLEIEIVPKDAGPSEPKNVLENLEKYVETYDYKKGHDSLWLVCDREKVTSRKNSLLEIIPTCEEKGYYLAIANPLFEFWLLLHIVDIGEYDEETLFKNERCNPESKNNKRRYIDKELSNKLTNGYNKKRNKFNKDIVSLENINRAINQEKKFENNINLILDNLGSNIGSLVSEILSID